jgi:hypothetical protein
MLSSTRCHHPVSLRRRRFGHVLRLPQPRTILPARWLSSSLAVQGKVAASSQKQALSALMFLYRHVLHQDLPWHEDVVRPAPKRLPVVLTREEVRAVLSEMEPAGDARRERPWGPPVGRRRGLWRPCRRGRRSDSPRS